MSTHTHYIPEQSRRHQHHSAVSVSLQTFQPLAVIFHVLSDATHLRLFWLLCHRTMDPANLAALLAQPEPEITESLQKLCATGLVVSHEEKGMLCFKAAPTLQGNSLHALIEDMLNVTCPDDTADSLIEQIHDYLMNHLDQHITIETLSERFFVNPTTLKEGFKAVYGTSLAAHIKEHRMHEAARLLRSTNESIAAIARAVGYTSQSRFSTAFKERYHVLPRDYRKKTDSQ